MKAAKGRKPLADSWAVQAVGEEEIGKVFGEAFASAVRKTACAAIENACVTAKARFGHLYSWDGKFWGETLEQDPLTVYVDFTLEDDEDKHPRWRFSLNDIVDIDLSDVADGGRALEGAQRVVVALRGLADKIDRSVQAGRKNRQEWSERHKKDA